SGFGSQGLPATQVASGVSNSLGLTRGSGVSASGSGAANGWGGSSWASTSAAGVSGDKVGSFGLNVSAGSIASLVSIHPRYRRGAHGPSNATWQYELNGGAGTTVGDFSGEFSSTNTAGADIPELDLTGVAGLQNLTGGTVVGLRLIPYGATNSGGTWYV